MGGSIRDGFGFPFCGRRWRDRNGSRRRGRLCSAIACVVLAGGAFQTAGQPAPDAAPDTIETLRQEAARLAPLLVTDAAREFVARTEHLPRIDPRVIYHDATCDRALTREEYEKLPEPRRTDCQSREYDAEFYYLGRYGTPLVYARPLDLVAREAKWSSFSGKRVLDFGYGMIGQLRLLASAGADTVGVDVQSLLTALYSQPGDQGVIKNPAGADGRIALVEGRFPGDERVRASIGEGFDLFMSKNTLKRGYIHPERETDKRMLIDLGVTDEVFVRAVFDVLKPGGYAIIYNLSPKQNPPDKPYIPWADGRCPFDRALLERVGFQVLAFDATDDAVILDYWIALGLNRDQTKEQLRDDLFSHFTLLRRPQ